VPTLDGTPGPLASNRTSTIEQPLSFPLCPPACDQTTLQPQSHLHLGARCTGMSTRYRSATQMYKPTRWRPDGMSNISWYSFIGSLPLHVEQLHAVPKSLYTRVQFVLSAGAVLLQFVDLITAINRNWLCASALRFSEYFCVQAKGQGKPWRTSRINMLTNGNGALAVWNEDGHLNSTFTAHRLSGARAA
jgi:hypothetical protein